MAYNYDEFGNVIGEYESEEERRAREAKELADTAVHTTERKVYGDGTVEEVTKKEIPANVAQTKIVSAPIVPQAQPQEGVAVVGPNGIQGTMSMKQPQFDREAYNASIAQQESGNRPDIGYHDRTKSTAAGLYGITAPAYQDARRVDPTLPEDITKATPEQQTQAHNIITDNNARYLQNKGIEITPGVLSAAHFAGPTGLVNFLTKKDEQGRPYISPQAQQANGGYDNARAILEGRLQGQAVPSSGAANQQLSTVNPAQSAAFQEANAGIQGETSPVSPYSLATGQGGPGIKVPGMTTVEPTVTPTAQAHELFQKNQDNLQSLIGMRYDQNLPEYIRKRSGDRAYELMNNEIQKQAAMEKAANLSPLEAGKVLTTEPKTQEGSWLKYALLSWINPKHAENEASKLNISPTTWSQSTIKDANGNDINVEIRTDKTGKMFEGVVAGTNQQLSPAQLQEAAGGVSTGKGYKPEVSGTAYVKTDDKGNVIARGVRTTQVVGNTTKTYIESGGKKYDINEGWQPESISTSTAKAEAGKKVSLAYDPIIAAATAGAKELGEANAKYGTNFAIVGYGAPGSANAGKPILVDQTTNQIVQPDASGKITTTTGPVGGTAALATNEKLRGERSQAMNKVLDEEVRPQAQAGDTVSSVRKQQFAIFDRPGIDANKLFGLANAAGEGENAQKFTMLRDLLSGYVARNSDGSPMNGQQLSERFAGLNLTPQEKSALAEYNIANQKINAATLKQTAGPGSVSDAEQRANKESNVDPTKVPALGAFNAMAQSQFDGDRARYKADWAASQTFGSALEMDKAWRKENQRLAENYANVAKERIKFINENGNTYNAVREGYRLFPVPEYDPGTESWKKTKPLSSFNR